MSVGSKLFGAEVKTRPKKRNPGKLNPTMAALAVCFARCVASICASAPKKIQDFFNIWAQGVWWLSGVRGMETIRGGGENAPKKSKTEQIKV